MIRVQNLEESLDFFVNKLGLKEIRRKEVPEGKYTLVFLAVNENESAIELTFNWDRKDPYSVGDNFGHIAYGVENIYDFCTNLQKNGVKILRPPRDGKMAFIRSPDQISIELLQIGDPLLPKEPWLSMENQGNW
tara:strand:+ start:599 stop:1000 length:402 start_codon:yes stop_codon:yes gene_type:complete